MHQLLLDFLESVYLYVWGLPLLVLISGAGIYLTFALKGIQFRYLLYALKIVVGTNTPKEGKGDITHFQSLMTALAASIGIGNIAGVSTAIVVGGYGALFWMWVTALLGMATKYVEAYLAIKFRHEDNNGEMVGGPMIFIEKGLGWRWLAIMFAFFGAFSSFGGGNMLQANSIAEAVDFMVAIPHFWTGIIIAILTGLTILGGIKSIGKVTSFLVPFMALVYLSGAIVVLVYHFEKIPMALLQIFTNAFSGQAAFGGFLGSTMMIALQIGVSRGLMTSEAGLGTASIAAAAAKSDVPGRQAMVSMTGSFIATIVLCTITGLVLSVTDVFGMVTDDGKLVTGVALTLAAFNSVLEWGGYIVMFGVIFFGFTTLIGWSYYGEKCTEYLFGEQSIPYFRIIFTLLIIPGAILDLEVVWKLSDVFNGLMAFPNLIGICALSGVVVTETKEYLQLVKKELRFSHQHE